MDVGVSFFVVAGNRVDDSECGTKPFTTRTDQRILHCAQIEGNGRDAGSIARRFGNDGFGGAWNKDQILVIFKDSRIGSFGATALTLSLLARYLLLVSLPLEHFSAYVISSQVLNRWSSLPLSYLLPPVQEQTGLGSQIARLTSFNSLAIGSLFSFAVVFLVLRWSSIGPVLLTLLTVALSGWFYFRKIGGVTGDCFGATNQLTEIVVYLCGVWIP